MEADWEVEIGPGAPVIDPHWPGFVDLRQSPQLALSLPEMIDLPELAEALRCLNHAGSPVWTAKCDVWLVSDPEDFDPFELDSTPEEALHAFACYIDLLPASDGQWPTPATAVHACKAICTRLHTLALSGCRVDLIVRTAAIEATALNIGITAYLTSGGKTQEAARQVLATMLGAFVRAIWPASTVE